MAYISLEKTKAPFVLAGSFQRHREGYMVFRMEAPQIVLPKEGTPMLSLEHDQVRGTKSVVAVAQILLAIFEKLKQRET